MARRRCFLRRFYPQKELKGSAQGFNPDAGRKPQFCSRRATPRKKLEVVAGSRPLPRRRTKARAFAYAAGRGEQRLELSLTREEEESKGWSLRLRPLCVIYAATLRHCPSPLFFPILSIVALALDRLSQRFRHPAGVDFVGSSPLFLSL
jgi:hypothetical protein